MRVTDSVELASNLAAEIEVMASLHILDAVLYRECAVDSVLNHVLDHDLHSLQIFFSLKPLVPLCLSPPFPCHKLVEAALELKPGPE